MKKGVLILSLMALFLLGFVYAEAVQVVDETGKNPFSVLAGLLQQIINKLDALLARDYNVTVELSQVNVTVPTPEVIVYPNITIEPQVNVTLIEDECKWESRYMVWNYTKSIILSKGFLTIPPQDITFEEVNITRVLALIGCSVSGSKDGYCEITINNMPVWGLYREWAYSPGSYPVIDRRDGYCKLPSFNHLVPCDGTTQGVAGAVEILSDFITTGSNFNTVSYENYPTAWTSMKLEKLIIEYRVKPANC